MELIRDDLLGWHPFRNLLARFAATPSGQDRARALTPHHALTTVRTALQETTEARRALTAEGPPPWDGTGDARPILAEAAPIGAVLDGPALVSLGRGLAAAARLRAYGQRIAAGGPRACERVGRVCPNSRTSPPRSTTRSIPMAA